MTPTGGASREFATDVVRQLRAAGYVALWAGGCVRDLLLERDAKDFDVATSATPEQVRTLFGKKRTLAVGQAFGVIIVLPPTKEAEPVEVATFRTEGAYLDGRRPSEVTFSTPEEDAKRRDFTINGMFYDPIEEQVLDYVGGQADLERRVLRAIGDPHARMSEDKLRMLRAVRFTATLEFTLDDPTRQAVQQMAPEVRVVSAERIAQELRKVLAHRTRVLGFELLVETGLLGVIFPEVGRSYVRQNVGDSGEGSKWSPASMESFQKSSLTGTRPPSGEGSYWEGRARSHDGAPLSVISTILSHLPPTASFELALAALLHRVPSPIHEPRTVSEACGTVWEITRRLKLSADEMTSIAWLVGHLDGWYDAEQLTTAQLKRVLAHPRAADLRNLVRAVRLASNLSLAPIEFIDAFVHRHTPEQINPPEFLSGRDLIEQGLAPGPRFKAILDTIRDAQLNGEITTREAALEQLKRLVHTA